MVSEPYQRSIDMRSVVEHYFFLKLQVISVALCSFPIAFDFWVIICIRYHEYYYTKQQKVTHREFVTRSCWVALMPYGLPFIHSNQNITLFSWKIQPIFCDGLCRKFMRKWKKYTILCLGFKPNLWKRILKKIIV